MAVSMIKMVEKALSAVTAPHYALPYGTAGFRTRADRLDHAVVRSVFLAILRSAENGGLATGLCITASHNGPQDNGVKLVDPSGGMLDPRYERFAESFLRPPAPSEAAAVFDGVCAEVLGVSAEDIKKRLASACVVLGRDTRASSPHLATLAAQGAGAVGCRVVDIGVVTTPMLQFAVYAQNEMFQNSASSTAEDLLEKYFEYFETVLAQFVDGTEIGKSRTRAGALFCDCANGVGSLYAGRFAKVLLAKLGCELHLKNTDVEDKPKLNCEAGAEFVQKMRKLPMQVTEKSARHCSFDGDADRLVYWAAEGAGGVQLLDGDKLAALYLAALEKLMRSAVAAATAGGAAASDGGTLRLAVVQTAYANGASTAYFKRISESLRSLPGVKDAAVVCTATGVKHLHHEACKYDIAIYFESNGHGTVLYKKENVVEWCKKYAKSASPPLLHFLTLLNPATGDAMADMLAAEAALAYLGWTEAGWARCYTDIAVTQSKVALPRATLSLMKPHPAHEQWLIEPRSLQEKLDGLRSAAGGAARLFVRPSGTEDVARVYAEAADEKTANDLALAAAEALKVFAQQSSC